MKISIVTPAYNEAKNLDRYFEAIGRLEYPREDFEVVIVNDGSSDETDNVIRLWIAAMPDIAIRVVSFDRNRGRAVAREEGAKAARYGHVFFLDVKCEVHSDALQALRDLSYPVVSCTIVHSTNTLFERFFWLVRRKIYSRESKDTYVTKENFDAMAKGGTFFCEKEIFLRSQISNKEDVHNSDDTKLLWNIVQTTPILKTARVKATYHQRVSFVENIMHLYQRGPKFVDYYYTPGKRYFALINLALFFALAFLTLLILRPEWLGYWVLTAVLVDVLVACFLGVTLKDIGVVMLMLPCCGLAFFAGIFKGLMKKRVISMGVMAISVIVIAVYLYLHRGVFTEIRQIKPVYLVPLFLGFIAQLYLNGLIFKVLVKPFGIDLKEHFLLSSAASFMNLVSPFSAGSGLRALYMRAKYHLSYRDFLSTLLGSYVIGFFVNSLFALITFYVAFVTTGLFNWSVSLFFLVMFLGSVVLMMAPSAGRAASMRVIVYLAKVIEGWKSIRRNVHLVLSTFLISAFLLIISAGITFFTFRGIGIEIGFWKSLYIAIVNTLLVFINITPSGIGVTEGLFVLSGQLVNVSPAVSLIVALIQRAVNTLVIVGFGAWSSYRLSISKKYVNNDLAHAPAESTVTSTSDIAEKL